MIEPVTATGAVPTAHECTHDEAKCAWGVRTIDTALAAGWTWDGIELRRPQEKPQMTDERPQAKPQMTRCPCGRTIEHGHCPKFGVLTGCT